MNRPNRIILWPIVVILGAAGPFWAQQMPPASPDSGAPPDGELRQAMQRYLHDQLLTVRQRVQFRFFIQRFCQELQRRVQHLRRDRMGGRGPMFCEPGQDPDNRP